MPPYASMPPGLVQPVEAQVETPPGASQFFVFLWDSLGVSGCRMDSYEMFVKHC